MSNNKAIEIILRIRPHPNRSDAIKLNQQQTEITFKTPKDKGQGQINNQRQTVTFKFDQIFQMDAKQEKVFDKVAKDVVEAAVDGYNGTIFAYGQTGSGKTFTMTGQPVIGDQGIIPRTLSYIFYLAETKGVEIKVKLRYMQIYNGTGYDLLDPTIDSKTSQTSSQKIKSLDDLQKVKPMDTGNGDLKLENLSIHLARNLQDAMDFFTYGDLNRITCKTPKNDQSTRSHCIFMISLETTKPDTDVKNVATINLVDLSGSQRIKETKVQGVLERQAISINLGLHFLERMIVALNTKMNGGNVHVPYRESLMNLILRDSIGGNCITRMIATMSPKTEDILETISTCKFAQRVALIQNSIQRNETVDPAIIIARLKSENAQLRAQLALLKGEDVKDELDKWEIQDCHKAVEKFLQSNDPAAALVMSDRLRINECFYFFKGLVKKGGGQFVVSSGKMGNESQNKSGLQAKDGGGGSISGADQQRYLEDIKKLKLALQSRQNEIALLLSLINKKRGGAPLESLPVNRIKAQDNQMMASVIQQKLIQFPNEQRLIKQEQIRESMMTGASSVKKDNWVGGNSKADGLSKKEKSAAEVKEIQSMLVKPLNLSNEDLLDHARAFEAFRVSSRRYDAMQKNVQVIKQKMKLGKQYAMTVHQSRQKIGKFKNRLEELRRQNAVKSLVDGLDREDPEQQVICNQISKTKEQYKQASQNLKGIKFEIDNIQILQKKNTQQLQKDFHKYVHYMQQQREATISNVDSSMLASNIRDKEVQKHLESFLKARDEIRKR